MPPGIQEVRGQDYQHRLHRLALLLYLLSEAGVLGDTPEVAMMTSTECCPECGQKLDGVLFEIQTFHDKHGNLEAEWFTCWVCDPEEGMVL